MGFLSKLPLYKASELRYLCEQLIPFTSLVSLRYGSCFCLFHPNKNTPAASLFKDKDGVERMYCYSCKKQYTSYDYITLVLEEQPIKYLLKNHTKEELDKVLEHKIDRYELKTESIVFKDIDNLLIELYNYDLALSPNMQ